VLPRIRAILVALTGLLAVPALARGGEAPPPTPFLGPGGEVRSLYAPEFQAAVGLLEDLASFGIEGLDAQLIGPLVPAPKPGDPPVPNRLVLRGQPEVVARAREVLVHLDVPRPAVAVSLLAAEVRSARGRERGGSVLFDRNLVPDSPDTIFRGGFGVYEPESYLRSSLTGVMPFQGTSLRFGNGESDWSQNGVFEMVLRMLQSERQATFLAWPTVLCTEGEPGQIESIVERPDRVVVAAGSRVLVRGDTATGGIVLTVIPVRVSRAGAVLDLVADIGVLLPEDPSDIPASNWIESRRRVATRVTVRDRESILVGGLKMRRRLFRHQGDPVFGAIPGVEAVASSESRDCVETELLLLLRARVMVPGSPVGITLPPGEARRLQREAARRPGQLGER
jgi:type II secretory pathway component GspD/PulD (secretin)